VVPFLSRPCDERHKSPEKIQDIGEINGEDDELDGGEPDVTVANGKEFRPSANTDRASQIQDEQPRHKHANVKPLVARDQSVQPVARFSCAILLAGANETQIVNEKQPDDRCVKRADGEPRSRVAQPREEKRLAQRADDVKEIVPKLQRPPDQCERMHDRARPENQNDKQSNRDVGPENALLDRQDVARVLNQKIERNALNDARQRELDADDHGVELAAAVRWRIHGCDS